MGPKYEFTDNIINHDGHILHRIRRLSDGRLGGYIEKEENLSQEGNCWVGFIAKVFGNAKVYGNAQVYDGAQVYENAQVYGNAEVYCSVQVYGSAYVYGNAEVYGDAQVYGNAIVHDYAAVFEDAKVYGNTHIYGNALVYDNANVYGNAKVCDYTQVHGNAKVCDNTEVYGDAQVYGNAKVCGDAKVYGNVEISKGCISTGDYDGTSNINVKNEEFEVIKDFVHKIDDSSKLDVQSNYDSVDAFFNDDSDDSYIDHECLTIIAIDTKIPILKLEKAQVKNKNIFKFIIDITNEEEDDADYSVKSIIDSKDKFEQLLHLTLESLHSYPQFSKYVEELENCL